MNGKRPKINKSKDGSSTPVKINNKNVKFALEDINISRNSGKSNKKGRRDKSENRSKSRDKRDQKDGKKDSKRESRKKKRDKDNPEIQVIKGDEIRVEMSKVRKIQYGENLRPKSYRGDGISIASPSEGSMSVDDDEQRDSFFNDDSEESDKNSPQKKFEDMVP